MFTVDCKHSDANKLYTIGFSDDVEYEQYVRVKKQYLSTLFCTLIDPGGLSGAISSSTHNISCRSHLPARGGCVRVCVCVKSLGISPSSRRPFKCMRQYHTILAGGGEMQVNYQNKKVLG